MTELYRNEGVVILECDNFKEHKPHTWRWGFLKLRKGSCVGLAADIVISQPKHKCKFQLHMYPEYPFINPNKVVLYCSGCGTWSSTDKDLFYSVLLSDKSLVAYRTKGPDIK